MENKKYLASIVGSIAMMLVFSTSATMLASAQPTPLAQPVAPNLKAMAVNSMKDLRQKYPLALAQDYKAAKNSPPKASKLILAKLQANNLITVNDSQTLGQIADAIASNDTATAVNQKICSLSGNLTSALALNAAGVMCSITQNNTALLAASPTSPGIATLAHPQPNAALAHAVIKKSWGDIFNAGLEGGLYGGIGGTAGGPEGTILGAVGGFATGALEEAGSEVLDTVGSFFGSLF